MSSYLGGSEPTDYHTPTLRTPYTEQGPCAMTKQLKVAFASQAYQVPLHAERAGATEYSFAIEK